jgi:type II secretory pathway component PulC
MDTGRTLTGGLAVGVAAYCATWLLLAMTLPTPASLLPALPELSWIGPETTIDPTVSRDWPALFGTAPAPVAATPAAPPPEFTTNLVLKGLISAAGSGWAILGDGGKEKLVRTGDDLGDGITVAAIDGEGVTLGRGDARLVLRFEAAGAGDPAAAPSAPAAEASPSGTIAAPVETVDLELTGLDRRDLKRLLARAGGISAVELDDGSPVFEVLFVRPGQLYDRIGLQQGDRLITLNGIAMGDDAAMMAAASELLAARTYTMDLIRDGRRMAIAVNLVTHD